MTLMLASVATAAEAETALAGGADIVDLKDPAAGALGALDAAAARAAIAAIGGRRPVSAAIGEPASPEAAVAAARAFAAAGADFVKAALAPGAAGAATIEALAADAGGARAIGVLFADRAPDFGLLPAMAGAGFFGAMLDTADKGGGRLLDHMDVAALAGFVEACRGLGLAAGLAGALEAPDAPRLLPLRPSLLGFRGALCAGGHRAGRLDAERVAMIRDLIPHAADARGADAAGGVDWRLLGRGYAPGHEPVETDRIFVRDFVLPMAIGAYAHERGRKQDVRFTIDCDIARARAQSQDMRDIFSYDVIVDAIRLIAGRGHIELVETLARDIADAVLAHPAALSVAVRVEKLDVIRGAVGVEIRRDRAREALERPSPAVAAFRGPRGL